MKYRKTAQSKRTSYTYHFDDGTSHTLYPGVSGVTEEHIKKLHAADDREVYLNCKNGHPPLTESERAVKEQWETTHPGEKFPANWTISLNYFSDEDNNESKSKSLEAPSYSPYDDVSDETERVREIVKTKMTEKQRQVYQLYCIDGYKLKDVAAILGMSVSTVYEHKKKIFEIIKKNFIAPEKNGFIFD